MAVILQTILVAMVVAVALAVAQATVAPPQVAKCPNAKFGVIP